MPCPEAAAPEPSSVRCVVRGDSDYSVFDEFPLYTKRDATRAIAFMHHPQGIDAEWSEFPAPTDGPDRRARIATHGKHTLRFKGWAPLRGRGFILARRVDIHPGHIWVRAGSPVEIDGEVDGRMHVVGYDEPFDAVTSCDAIAWSKKSASRGDDDVRRTGGTPVYPLTDAFDLAAEPDGCPLASLAWSHDVFAFEQRDGWAHVRGGGASYVFDGWAPLAQLTHVAKPRDRDFSDPADDTDGCPREAHVIKDAEVRVGETADGEPFASIDLGTTVHIVRRRGEFVAFELPSKTIIAPPKEQLWLPSEALDQQLADGVPVEDDDGCD